jgi:hypothetical protein
MLTLYAQIQKIVKPNNKDFGNKKIKKGLRGYHTLQGDNSLKSVER